MTRRQLSAILTAAVGLLTLAVDLAGQERFTLEQVLSSPFPAGLVAAPAGQRLAWVFNAEGVRNIWVAVGPNYAARRVTQYSDDDGQAISDVQWTPDGSTLVFVRGGGPNRRGEYPNPWSLPGGVSREIWAVDSNGGEPRSLTAGAGPALDPTGEGLAFLRRDGIWWISLEGGEPEPLVQVRGGSGTLRWSPDGQRLAFVSSRGDHSFVGVYDRQAKRITWLDPSVDRDVYPVWSPDGRRIAFARIPAGRNPLPFGPQRSGQPWSIRVADVASGTGREVWRADPGPGSVPHNVVAEDQLWWGAGDRLVFPWEKDGWRHLYSVDLDGGEAELLTPGNFEVEYVALSPDRRTVIYNSNQDDIDRRHLWSVPVAGGRPMRLTPGEGIEWAPTPAADGEAIALLRSDARRPARPAILIGQRIRDLAPTAIPDDFPSDVLVEPQPVIFSAADGLQIHGQLFMPRDARPGDGRPAVLFFHGGSRRQMLLGFHYGAYYHNAYAFNQYLASRGFIVLSVNYRSGIGYGMEFREALDYGATGASEFDDVLGAGLYVRGRPEVNGSRVGLWGGSYGGYLTALGLARASDLFAAGVDFHGVHDWNVVINNFRPDYNPKEHPEFARAAFEASPMAAIETWRSPVLLIHGDDDRNVPFSETVDLVAALRAHGVEFQQLVFPDEVHGFTTHARWLQAYRASADFLEGKLRR
ncbi:MAG: prolyl oligopeptidase family serine peptidase [Gemmatimonadales bacterium]|jgi:dipeptidyl aminopeptidase/acylaminoacyl peptidase